MDILADGAQVLDRVGEREGRCLHAFAAAAPVKIDDTDALADQQFSHGSRSGVKGPELHCPGYEHHRGARAEAVIGNAGSVP